MQKKIVFFSVAVLLLILSAGCIKADMKIKVNSNGTGNGEVILDLSGIGALGSIGSGFDGNQNNATTGENYKKDKICETLTKNQSEQAKESQQLQGMAGGFDFKNASCEGLADYKAKLSVQNVDLVKSGALTISDNFLSKKYAFKYKSVPSGGSSGANPSMLKTFGASINLTVEMPGTIQSTNAGKISEDKKSVTVDLLDEFDKMDSGIEIVSEEPNTTTIAIVAIAIIAVIVLGIALLRKKKK